MQGMKTCKPRKGVKMQTEQDIRRMASEELANKFNKMLDDGHDVVILVNVFNDVKQVLIMQDSTGSHYLIKSGVLTIECTDVYMTACECTVTLRCDVGRTNVIYHTMVTEDVQLNAF